MGTEPAEKRAIPVRTRLVENRIMFAAVLLILTFLVGFLPFDRIREVANQTLDSADRKSLEDVLSLRDPITAKLATGNPEVLSELRALLIKAREATAASSGGQR
jgi:ABC-type dipeptide/oligopeptide/nickel transport system permease component